MSEQKPHPPCYCIAGHHRSGTSLVTSMLAAGGVDVGRRLLGAGHGNVRGHFEDLDFFEIQVESLRRLGLPGTGFTEATGLRPPAELAEKAAALVEGRRAGGAWGWKDPRSTLFLDFWAEAVPELRFVLLFRPPWEVIDSLFRRGDVEFREQPGAAARVWLSYNRAVIDFHDRFPDRCIIVEGQAAAESPERFADALAERFGQRVGVADGLYDPDLLRHDTAAQDRAALAAACPAALEVYEQLRQRAALALPEAVLPGAADPDLLFRHWSDCRAAEARLREAAAAAAAHAAAAEAATATSAAAAVHERNAAAARMERDAANLQRDSLAREARVRDAHIARLEQETRARASRIAQLEHEARTRDAHIAHVEHDWQARGAHIEYLEREARARDARSTQVEHAAQARIAQLEREAQARIAQLEHELRVRDEQLRIATEEASRKAGDFLALISSRSWRLASAIRRAAAAPRRLVRSLGARR